MIFILVFSVNSNKSVLPEYRIILCFLKFCRSKIAKEKTACQLKRKIRCFSGLSWGLGERKDTEGQVQMKS